MVVPSFHPIVSWLSASLNSSNLTTLLFATLRIPEYSHLLSHRLKNIIISRPSTMSSTISDLRTILLRRSARIKQAALELETLRAHELLNRKSIKALHRSQVQLEKLHQKMAAQVALSGDKYLEEWTELRMSMNLLRGTLQATFKDFEASRDTKRSQRERIRRPENNETYISLGCPMKGLLINITGDVDVNMTSRYFAVTCCVFVVCWHWALCSH